MSVTTEKVIVQVSVDGQVTLVSNISSALGAASSAAVAEAAAAAALVSETNADASATDAAASAAAALVSEGNADTSEANAAASAAAALVSEGNADTSAGDAATSASNALTSANNADVSEAAAAASAAAALVSQNAAAASAASAATATETLVEGGTLDASFASLKSSGDIVLAGTKKFYVDGVGGVGGDTYLVESSANILNAYVGGSAILTLGTNYADFAGRITSSVSGNSFTALGDSLATYHGTGGADSKRWDTTFSNSTMDMRLLNDANSLANSWLTVTRSGYTVSSIQLDGLTRVMSGVFTTGSTPNIQLGDTATYWKVTYGSNVLHGAYFGHTFEVTGTPKASISANGFGLVATGKLYLDGVAASGDTYLVESSANVMDMYAGGVNTLRLNASGAAVTGSLSTTGNASINKTGGLISFYNTGGTVRTGYIQETSGTGLAIVGEVAASVVDTYANNSKITTVSSTGLAITGGNDVTSIGGTQTLVVKGGNTNNDFVNQGFATSAGGTIAVLAAKATTTGAYPTSVGELHVGIQNGGSTVDVATFSATGLAVTGLTTSGRFKPTTAPLITEAGLSLYSSGAFLNTPTGTTGYLAVNGGGILAWSGTAIQAYQNFIVPATYKIYLDGGSNTYLVESSADVLDLYAGGVKALSLTTAGATITGTMSASGPMTLSGASGGLNIESRDGTGATFALYNPTGDDFRVYGNSADIALFSSNGLDVLGSVSARKDTNAVTNTLLTLRNDGAGVGTGVKLSLSGTVERGYLMLDYDGVRGWQTTLESYANISLRINGAEKALLTADALAVTGQIQATGAITSAGSAGLVLSNPVAELQFTGASYGWIRATQGHLYIDAANTKSIFQRVNGSLVSTISATGVDVVGTFANTNTGNRFLNGYKAAFADNLRVIGSANPQIELWHDGSSAGQFNFNSTILTYGYHGGGGTQITQFSSGPGWFAIPSTNKLYLDGASDTYLVESSANVLDLYVGGVNTFKLTTAGVAVTGTLSATGATKIGSGTAVTSAGRDYLTIGGTSLGSVAFKNGSDVVVAYMQSGATSFDFYANTGGTLRLGANGTDGLAILSSTGLAVTGALNATGSLSTTATLYARGYTVSPLAGEGVEIDYGAAGVGIGRILAYDRTGLTAKAMQVAGLTVDIKAGAGLATVGSFSSTGLALAATGRLSLDGGGDTYLVESSANVLDAYAGGVNALRLTTAGATVTGTFSSTGDATVGPGGATSTDATFTINSGNSAGGEAILSLARGGVASGLLYHDGTTMWLRSLVGGSFVTYSGTLVHVADATDATSTTAASLRTSGGLGVAKKAYFGDSIRVAGGGVFAKAAANLGQIEYDSSNGYLNISATSNTGYGAIDLYGTNAGVSTKVVRLNYNGDAQFQGNISTPATFKHYLDGGGDTYITESSANVLDMYVGGARAFTGNTYGINVLTKITLGAIGSVQDALKDSGFGYSYSYRVVQLGQLGSNRAISLGVDVSGNPSAGFTGNEIVVPHTYNWIAPNADNTAFNSVMNITTAGRLQTKSGFTNKQAGENYINGIFMQRSSTVDTWTWVVGGDNALYLGYADNASGADASGDFTQIMKVAPTAVTIGTATAGYLYERYSNQILIGADSGGYYVATGGGVSPSLPIYYGTTGTTIHRFQTYAGGYVEYLAAGTGRLRVAAAFLALPATNKLYFDGVNGTGHTYLVEQADNDLSVVVGGTQAAKFTPTGQNVYGQLEAYKNVNSQAIYATSESGVGGYQVLLEGRYNGYGAGIAMASRTSSGGTLVAMAHVVADGISPWNTTASTQDAVLSFKVAKDGVLGTPFKMYGDRTLANAPFVNLYNTTNAVVLGSSGVRTNGYKITTNIPQGGDDFCVIHVHGYDYRAGRVIDIKVCFYNYSFGGGSLINYSATSAGNWNPGLTLGYEGGFVVLFMNLAMSDGYYVQFDVDVRAYIGDNPRYYGWTISDTAYAGTGTVTPTYSNRMGYVRASNAITLAATAGLWLDGVEGTGDTYIVEGSANTVMMYAGGNPTITYNATGLAVTGTLSATAQNAATFLSGSATTRTYLAIGTSSAAAFIGVAGSSGGVIVGSSSNDFEIAVDSNPIRFSAGVGRSSANMVLSSTGLALAATSKLYLDGGSDTYLVESSANVLDMYSGGVNMLRLTTTGATVTGTLSATDNISTAKSLRFTASLLGADTDYWVGRYLTNVVYNAPTGGGHVFGIANGDKLTLSSTTLTLGTGVNLTQAATTKLYLDGGGDTYLVESSANVLDVYAGGVNALKVKADSTTFKAGSNSLQIVPDYVGSGLLPASVLISTTGAQNICFMADASVGTAGKGIGAYYWNGAAWYPSWVANNVAGGGATRGTLSLMPNGGAVVIGGNVSVPKTSGKGIQVDETWSWRDLEGVIQPKSTGAGTPIWKTWSGNIKEWAFVANDVIDLKFHWPHDWVPGTDVYIHVHWSHNGTAISGTFTMDHRHMWGKGHGQSAYDAEKTISTTASITNIAGHPALTTFITEVQLSAASPSASQIDTDNLEADGLLKVSSIVSSLPTVTGGDLFVEYIDIHYQSSNVGTKNKAPNFHA